MKTYLITFFFGILFSLHCDSIFAQGQWTPKANFGGTARYGSAGFSIASKGYIGMGYDGANHNDLWEWDQTTNLWSQKANCPGAARRVCVGFSIGNKGYISCGYSSIFLNDLWEWDQPTNTWLQKANLPTNGRYGAACFVIGNNGYIGCGNSGNAFGPYFNDFWEWNQATNIWTQKANYPSGAKYGVSGFAVGNKGYFGFGYDHNIATLYNDLWEWNQGTDSWSQKADLPCDKRHYSASFSIGTKGYIVFGQAIGGVLLNDLWEFDTSTDSWKQKANFGGGDRWLSCGFSISAKGYVGTGLNSSNFNDFWEYDTLSLSISNTNILCGNTVNFSTTISGADSYLWNFGDGTTSTLANPTKIYSSDGNYNVSLVVFWSCGSDTAYQSVSINSPALTNKNFAICSGDSIFLQGNYQTTSGTYYDTLSSVNSCDSIIKTILSFNPVYNTTTSNTICSGSSFVFGTQTLTASGTYSEIFPSVNGCDSTITLFLSVTDTTTNNFSVAICSGDNYTFGSQILNDGGIYSDTLISSGGCDSIVTLTLSVYPVYSNSKTTAICDNDSIFLQGTYQNTSGIYHDTISSINGCDSIIETALVINQTSNSSIQVNICNGDSVFIQGNFQASSGIFFDTLTSMNGCDSIVTQTLNVNGPDFSGFDSTVNFGTTIQLSAAGGNIYQWSTGETSQNISVNPEINSIFTVTVSDANGCSATAIFNITVEDNRQFISVPSIFSPNSDGNNDIIKVHGFGVKEYKLYIFDRWGELIFEDQGPLTSSGGLPWDGTHNSKILNSAVFVYSLEALFTDGTEFHEKGNITLVK